MHRTEPAGTAASTTSRSHGKHAWHQRRGEKK
jgi:hypothetical protein